MTFKIKAARKKQHELLGMSDKSPFIFLAKRGRRNSREVAWEFYYDGKPVLVGKWTPDTQLAELWSDFIDKTEHLMPDSLASHLRDSIATDEPWKIVRRTIETHEDLIAFFKEMELIKKAAA